MTVAVSTFREGYFDWVVQLLESLKNQTLKEFEVLVVVNTNYPYFVKLKDMIADRNFPYAVRVIFNPVDRGIACARNIALKSSSTEYIAFTDDDAIPHPGWLRALNETFNKNNEVGAVTGPVLPQWSSAVRAFRIVFPRELYWIIGCTISDSVTMKVVRNGFASNLALNRKSAIECGGFNEAFGYSLNNRMVGEEPELCIRLKRKGRVTLWNPDSIVFHRVTSNRVRLRSLLERSFAEGKSKARLRRVLGNETMGPEVTHFKSVLKAIIKAKTFESKAMLIITTLAVLLGFIRD